MQNFRLARAGHAAENNDAARLRQSQTHMTPIGLVAAGQQLYAKAGGFQQPAHSAAAHAAAPAVQQDIPAAGRHFFRQRTRTRELAFQFTSDERQRRCHGIGASLAGVHGADAGALRIVEQGQIEGSGNMGVLKFGRGADIQQENSLIPALKKGGGVYGGRHGGALPAEIRNWAHAGHALSPV